MAHVWLTLIAAYALDTFVFARGLSWSWRRAVTASLLLNTVTFAVLAGITILPVGEVFFWGLVAPLFGLPVPLALLLASCGFALLNMAIKWPLCLLIFAPVRPRACFTRLALSSLACGAVLVSATWYLDHPEEISQEEIARLEAAFAPEIAFMAARMDEMRQFAQPPWQDADWARGREEEARALRFAWLDLRHTPHERLTPVARAGEMPVFTAQSKADRLWVLRADAGDLHHYRYIMIESTGRGAERSVAADFVISD
ncbi:hypothetical protein [Roseovarius aestuariivivens]|uniref:hypothetical protein n=1 Tax=Roseovarius aestuariivivens TaxID=1888910 RepID=UPI001081C249|nr:hypothetical protein [Roseovarius aestuariivivens]